MKNHIVSFLRFCLLFVLIAGVAFQPQYSVYAAANLTVTPITWNVVGLDSNNVNVGPNHFPIGARVCNTGDAVANNVKSSFVWDSSDPYIDLRGGTRTAYASNGTNLAPGTCTDFYYEVEVTRNSAAYDHTRNYHIAVTADGGLTGSTPTPRVIYVEHLVSQSRNAVTDIQLNGVSVAPGGTMNLMVGQTYTIKLVGYTATQGYEQIEYFINFPNTIFQIISATSTFTADTSAGVSSPNDKLYGDNCVWENDPNSPNYRACLSTGKTGGNVEVTYQVRILQVPGAPLVNPQPLSTLIYDFSGSSFHYNADYDVSTRYAYIVSAGVTKSFSPKTIQPNGTSTLTFKINNPGPAALTGVNFTDDLPVGMTLANSTVTYTGCGSPLPATVSDPMSFSNITVAGLSSCTIAVTVTAAADGTYNNTTGNLFINTSTDTGNSASDSLIVSSKPAAPSSCTGSEVTLASWSFPATGQGSGGGATTPDYTTKAGNVATATALYTAGTSGTSAISTTQGSPAVNSWSGTGGWAAANTGFPSATTGPYFTFAVDTSNYGGVRVSFNYALLANGDWANPGNNFVYAYSSADGAAYSNTSTIGASKGNWFASGTINATATGANTTAFRINAVGANKTTSAVYIDQVVIQGCARPSDPTLSKAFSPATIAQGNASTLTFTFTNPSTTAALTGVGFTDTLPTGLLIATPNGLLQSCSSGTFTGATTTATQGTSTITVNGGALSTNASCTISVNVLGNVAGTHTNVSGNISSTQTGPNTTSAGYGTSSLTVVAPPVINKAFTANPIFTGNTTTLTFTISNPNTATPLTGISFTDTLPAGVDIANSSSPQCGGTLTATNNNPAQDTITLSGGSLIAGASCSFSVTVTGTTTGLKTNSVTVSSTNGGTGNTSTADVLVKTPAPAINLLKQVGSTASGPWTPFLSVVTGANVYYRFVVENVGDQALSSVSVTDTGNASLNALTCSWIDGDGTVLVNNQVVTTSFSLPVADANDNQVATCVIAPIAALVGTNLNTASASGTNGATVTDTSGATYAGYIPPTVTKSFGAASIAAGGSTTLTLTVTNPNTNPGALTTVQVDDTFPAGLTLLNTTFTFTPAACGTITNTSGGASVAGDGNVRLSVASVAVGASCQVDLNVTGSTLGVMNNTSGTVTATGPFALTGGTANASLTVGVPPTITKSFGVANLASGGNTNLTVTIGNINASAITLTSTLTDTFPTGMTINIAGNTGTCTGVTATAGVGDFTIANGTSIPAGGCTVIVNVTSSTSGAAINTIPAGALQTNAGNNASPATSTLNIFDASPTKSIVSTSELSTGLVAATERVTIGEIVRYRLMTRIPQGSFTNVQILDGLPTGLQFLNDNTSTVAFVCNGGAGCMTSSTLAGAGLVVNGSSATISPTFILPGSAITGGPFGSGSDITFSVGNITNSDVDIDSEFLVIEFNALVLNVNSTATINQGVDNQTGASNTNNRQNDVTLRINGLQVGAISPNVTVSIAEPAITAITKSVVPATGPYLPGDALTYTMSFSNNATGLNAATAFDIVLTDTFNADLTLGTVNISSTQGTSGVDTCAGGTSFTTGSSTAGQLVTINISCLDPGETVTVTVAATIDLTSSGTTISNSAGLTYTSLPGAQGNCAAAPFSCSLIGTSGAGTGERNGIGGSGADGVVLNNYAVTSNTVNSTIAYGNITITKDAVPNSPQDFNFTGSGTNFAVNFNVDDDSDPTLISAYTFLVAPGSYSFTEGAVAGWSLTGLTCTDPDSGSTTDLGTATATIDLDAGENIICTFTNTGNTADLAITKTDGVASVTANGTTTYTIVVSNAGPSAANNAVFTDLAAAGINPISVLCGSASGGAACPSAANTTVSLMQGAGIVIPTLPSGGSVMFTVTMAISATSGNITNTATITPPAGVTDSNNPNNNASDTNAVTSTSTTYSIGDFVWLDLDLDGVQDGGAEAGIAGVTVYLDLNNNNAIDGGEPTDVTDAGGLYQITGLTAGTYTVRIDTTTLPAGYIQTYDLDATLDHETVVVLPSDLSSSTAGSFALSNVLGDCVAGVRGCPSPYPPVLTYGALNGNDNAYNVFIGGNFTAINGSAEAEGKMFVYGDFNMNKNNGIYNVGYVGVGSFVVPDAGQDYLTVGGNINVPNHTQVNGYRVEVGGTAGLDSAAGNVVYKGTITPAGDAVYPDPVEITAPGTITNTPALNLAPFDTVFTNLATGSACWSNVSTPVSQGTVTKTGSRITFASVDGVARTYVFNVDTDIDSTYNGAGGGVEIAFDNFPAGASIVINMNKAGSGDNIKITSGEFFVNGTQLNVNSAVQATQNALMEKVLWNFSDVSTVNITAGYNLQFRGAILVPSRASSTTLNVSTNGRFVAGGNVIQGGNAGLEFHNFPFRGVLPSCDFLAADFGYVDAIADLVVTKTDGVASVNAGGTTTYTLTLTNNGPSAANNSTLSDPVVAGLSKTTIGVCTPAGGAVCPTVGAGAGQMNIANLEAGTVVIPTLPNGGSLSFTVTANVTATNGSVANTFTSTPPVGTTDPTPATVTDTDTVNPIANLVVTKTDGITNVQSGTVTAYTLTLTNNGPSAANNATLSDPAVVGLSKTTIGVCTPAGGAVCPTVGAGAGQMNIANLEAGTVVIPTLPNGGSISFTVTANVTASSGTVANTFTSTPPVGTTDPTPATTTDTDTVIAINAVTDTGSTVDGTVGGQSFADVLTNDTLNGNPATLANITLTQVSTTHAGVTLNPADGSVNVAPGTPAGNYTVTYQICDQLNPTICDTATVTVPVVVIDAVNDTGSSVNGYTGGQSFANVLTNDTLNGNPATLANITLTQVSTTNASVTLNPADGSVNVAVGTPAGNYTVTYQICDQANPAICDIATVSVPVTAALINAVDDNGGPVNGLAGATNVLNVFTNDTLNGVAVVPAQVTLTQQPGGDPELTLNANGSVDVAPNTPAGPYTLDYQICEVLNPTNCDIATVTVTVVAAPIVANDDDYSATPVNGYTGGNAGNAFTNDTLNGVPVIPANITATITTPASNPGVAMNTATGAVTVAAGTPAGTYTIDYQICENLNPTNCDTAVVTVVVNPPVINAVDDNGGPVNGLSGATNVLNVFTNDTLNGVAVVPAQVTLTQQPGGDPELTLNPNGSVDVAPNTPAGPYTLDYQICENLNPTNCDTAVVTVVVVPAVINAVDDSAVGVNGLSGATNVLNVFTNDTLNGVAVVPAQVTLTQQPGGDPELTLNPNGSVDVAPNTPAGPYTLDYQICEVLNPTNCDIATVTVTVVAAPIVANDDNYSATPVNGYTGGNAGNAFLNDTLNGVAVNPADITATVTTPASNAGVTLNTGTGSVDIAAGTPAGTYTIDYQICENLNPANCDPATITVVVAPAVINAVDDSAVGVNGLTGATNVLNVFTNDTLNGVAVIPAEVTLTQQPGGDPELTLNPNGSVDVAPNTPSGTYTLDYQICEILNPTNCDIATVTITVNAAVINAVDDNGGPVSGLTGATNVLNVFTNDTLNGVAVVPAEVTLTQQPGGDPELTLNANGSVAVAPNTPAGLYTLDYEICEILNPNNCDIATVTITVVAAPIVANDDDYSATPVNGYTGGNAGNAFTNDTLNGVAVNLTDITATITTPASNPGVTMNTGTGAVTVAAGTPAGTYTIDYQICENLNPTNCDTAVVTVLVAPAVINAVNDSATGINGITGATNVLNVFTNDTLNNVAVVPAEVTLTQQPGGDPELTLNPNGSVDVAPNTPAGPYTLDYQICENLNPTNCDIATVTITVVPVAIIAVDDNYSATPVNGYTGGNAGNAFLNDTLNGVAVNVTDITATVTASTSPNVSLNTATGAVTAAPNTPAGTYTIDYQICENLNLANCDTAVVTVVVNPAVINAVNDSATGINGITGATNVLNVFTNDTLNGAAVIPAEVTLTQQPGGDPELTLNPNGSVDVAPGTAVGTYQLTYEICEVLNPTNCDTAIVSVTVGLPPAPTATDNSTSTPFNTPATLPNITTNDTAFGAGNSIVISTIDLDPAVGQQTTFTDTSGNQWSANTTTGDVTFTPAPNFTGVATIPYTVQDAAGQTATANLSVTVAPPASISGVVFHDVDLDGSKLASESGIVGVIVNLYDGTGATLIASTTTGAGGTYDFPNLTAGNYLVVEVDPAGYVSSTANSVPVTLIAGGSGTANFGDYQLPNTALSNISGVVFNDANGNGVQDAGETPLSGVTVELENNLGIVIATTTTNASGAYTFTNLSAGTYTVVETDLPGYVSTTLNNIAVTLSAGTNATINYGDQTVVGNPLIADPAVTKLGTPSSAVVGDVVVYTITVGNNGNTNATNVILTDTKPAFLDIISISISPNPGLNPVISGNTFTINFGTVTPTDFYTITVITRVNVQGVPPGGVNNAAITTNSGTDRAFNNASSAQLVIPSPSGVGGSASAVVITALPATGFAPHVTTSLPAQPSNMVYAATDVMLEIPSLGVKISIVGVSKKNGAWDVTWLGKQAGWLEGTAFPSWNGNSVLTSHVYDSNGLPGPFVNLGKLKYGDKIIIHAYGQKYTFEVRTNQTVAPNDTSALKHEEKPWLTLVTCKEYDEKTNTYKKRVIVRAVLVSVDWDK